MDKHSFNNENVILHIIILFLLKFSTVNKNKMTTIKRIKWIFKQDYVISITKQKEIFVFSCKKIEHKLNNKW